MCIFKEYSTEDTSVGNMIKINATKIQGSMAPHALKRKIDIIIVIGFPILVQRQ